MKRILVPSDFSACADNALQFAFSLAKDSGAEVFVLHSFYPAASADMGYYNTFMLEEYLRVKEKTLEEKISVFRNNALYSSVKCSASVEYGFPVQSICDAADSHDADLVVMGTTGASGIKEMIMGSTAGSVIVKSRVPVLALPVNATYENVGSDFLLSTDFNLLLNTKSREVLREMIALKNASLTILHQVTDHDTRKKVDTGEIILDILFHDVKHSFDFLDGNDLNKALNEYIDKKGGSLICMVSHHHGFFEKLFFKSMSRDVAHHTRLPLLVLQEK